MAQQQAASSSHSYPIQHDYGTMDLASACNLAAPAVGMHGPYTTPMTTHQQLSYQHGGSGGGAGGNQLSSYPPIQQHHNGSTTSARIATGMTPAVANVNLSGGPSNSVSVPSNVTTTSTGKTSANKNQQKLQRHTSSGSTNGTAVSKNEHKNVKPSSKLQQQNKAVSGAGSDGEFIYFI